MNIKHHPLFKKKQQKTASSYATIVTFFAFKSCTSTIHENHSIQQLCSKQLYSHVWTISLIVEPFFHIFSADGVIKTCVCISI